MRGALALGPTWGTCDLSSGHTLQAWLAGLWLRSRGSTTCLDGTGEGGLCGKDRPGAGERVL